jgi:hypothetical protein
MKVVLYDQAGFQTASVVLKKPLTPVLIWGENVYIANGTGYREVPYTVIDDTAPSGVYDLGKNP